MIRKQTGIANAASAKESIDCFGALCDQLFFSAVLCSSKNPLVAEFFLIIGLLRRVRG